MKTWNLVPAAFFLIGALAFGDDFKTIDGREYKNVTVSRVEPDGIVLITSSGISKVYFTELPKPVQQRFHYDATKAAVYSSQQIANQEAFQTARGITTETGREKQQILDRPVISQKPAEQI